MAIDGNFNNGRSRPQRQASQAHSTGKRRRPTKENDQDTTDHPLKRPKGQENCNQQPQEIFRRGASQPTRRSPRLKKIQNLSRQRAVVGKNQTRSSVAATQQHQSLREKQFLAGHNASGISQQGARSFNLKHVDSEEPKVAPKNAGTQKLKRQHSVDSRAQTSHDSKRLRHNWDQFTAPGTRPDKRDLLESWLDESCRRASTENEEQIQNLSDDMPRNTTGVLPSPGVSVDGTKSTSSKSERSAASVHDIDYHRSLGYRNIYIEHEEPPVELMRRAQRIVSRPRLSPEMDDATAKKLKEKSRKLRNESEDVIIKQLASHIIPAMDDIPDQRLAMNSDQMWSNSIPLSLDPSVLTNPLPLPRPKPDLAFGYAEAAFTRNQLGTIDLLIDDQFGRSYVVPDQKLRFPFLDVEFKSQAKNGTHYNATNQVAGAGAIALNGSVELMQRSFGMEDFDYDEPQFFSVTMDHQLACVNVHWLRSPAEGQYSFHVEGLSKHLLDDANGLRAVTRAVKNILDYGVDARLRTLCNALDAYREAVVRDRKAAIPRSKQRNQVQPELKPEPRLGRKGQQPQYDEQTHQTYGPQPSSKLQESGVSKSQRQSLGRQGNYKSGTQPPLYQSKDYGAVGAQQLDDGQQENHSSVVTQRPSEQRDIDFPAFQGMDSRSKFQVDGFSTNDTQLDEPLRLPVEQRSLSKGTTRGGSNRGRASVSAKARRTSSKRSAEDVE